MVTTVDIPSWTISGSLCQAQGSAQTTSSCSLSRSLTYFLPCSTKLHIVKRIIRRRKSNSHSAADIEHVQCATQLLKPCLARSFVAATEDESFARVIVEQESRTKAAPTRTNHFLLDALNLTVQDSVHRSAILIQYVELHAFVEDQTPVEQSTRSLQPCTKDWRCMFF